jgi:hypothetical protein
MTRLELPKYWLKKGNEKPNPTTFKPVVSGQIFDKFLFIEVLAALPKVLL